MAAKARRPVGRIPQRHIAAAVPPNDRQHRQRAGLASAPPAQGYPAARSAMHPYRDNVETLLRELLLVVLASFGGSKKRLNAAGKGTVQDSSFPIDPISRG